MQRHLKSPVHVSGCMVIGCQELCLLHYQGPYVLVLVAMGASGFGPEDERRSRLPAMWLIKYYSKLTRPYKKNACSSFVYARRTCYTSPIAADLMTEVFRFAGQVHCSRAPQCAHVIDARAFATIHEHQSCAQNPKGAPSK